MNKIVITAALVATVLGTFIAEANAASGGFCRSMGQEAPTCQR